MFIKQKRANKDKVKIPKANSIRESAPSGILTPK